MESMSIQLLSVKEAASLLSISPNTLRAWFVKRQFPYVKVGRRTLVKLSYLEEYITNNSVDAVPEGKLA